VAQKEKTSMIVTLTIWGYLFFALLIISDVVVWKFVTDTLNIP